MVRRKQPKTHRAKLWVWVLGGLAVLAGGYGIYLRLAPPEQEEIVLPATPETGVVTPKREEGAPSPGRPEENPPQEADSTAPPGPSAAVPGLPALPESDDFARQTLSPLSTHPAWRGWLAQEQLVRRIAALLDNLSKGEIVRRDVSFLAPKGGFKAIERDIDRYVIDPSSYQRYNGLSDAIASIDAGAAARAYERLKPLLQQAGAELGHAGQSVGEKLLKALDHLLATPAVSGEIELFRPSVMYKFKNPELERLSPAQKQLLRMGPRNMQKIKAKLREIKAALRQDAGPG